MCNIDWDTFVLTVATCAVAAGVTAWLGAKYAFKNDKKLEADRARKEELNHIFSYYGYLMNLFHGYNQFANSLNELGKGYRIENNLSKIQNIKNNWGCLNFVMNHSTELFEQTFSLEKDIDSLIEKANSYAKETENIKERIITIRLFTEVYKKTIAMIINYSNYSEKYYNKQIMTTDLMATIKEAENLSDKLVKDVCTLNSTVEALKLKDDDAYLKRIEDIKKWYIKFD